MQRSRLLLGCLAFVLAVALLIPLAGCGGSDEDSGATGGDELGNILGKAGDIQNIKYDQIMTMPDQQQTTSKIWLKDEKMRMESTEEGETIVVIVDGDARVMYIYYPSQNLAMQMDYADAPESDIESTGDIEEYDPDVVGTETIDGKACLVVTYTAGDIQEKAWIWKDKGFPIRVETTTSEGVTVIQWKNIDFGTISNSVFQLPDGVEIMTFPYAT